MLQILIRINSVNDSLNDFVFSEISPVGSNSHCYIQPIDKT